jgi:hypothetical protein
MGKLNLLHHKDWHVYSKDNRERVLKDEKKAMEDEVATQARAIQADQERRIHQLRKTKQQKKLPDKNNDNINLFADYEKRVVAMDKLKDEDKKADEIKWEAQFTTYLVKPEDSVNASKWYTDTRMLAPGPSG